MPTQAHGMKPRRLPSRPLGTRRSKGSRSRPTAASRRNTDVEGAVHRFATRGLTRAERLVVMLYYFEEMTFKEIGDMLGLSEDRVGQMHSAVLARVGHRTDRGRTKGTSERRKTRTASLYDRLRNVVGKAKGLPPDGALNHDHYLYGYPKK